ncbi:MAG TPA: flagellar protein FliS [Sphingomicrobium sp.]|nr:flagellar protein FliS [Sphingomicrobium sp.]
MHLAQKRYEALSITSRIEGASPHELVVILYEELLRSLDVARSALVLGKADAFRSGRERSMSILIALEASLDIEQGGDLAALLGGIYRSMRRELASFGAGGSPEKLEALRSGIAELLEAWTKIGVRQAA